MTSQHSRGLLPDDAAALLLASWPLFAGAAVALAVLGLVVMLVSVLRLGAQMQRLRLLAEQGVAGQKAESETIRVHLASTERGLTARVEQMRLEQQEHLGRLAMGLAQADAESRVMMETKLREMAEAGSARLAAIEQSVGAQLHAAMERQMTNSFQRVLDQFAAVQKAMADVQAVSAGIGDLKRIFSNVKTRGGWGETQLRALLDDLLPPGGYLANAALWEGRVVEFAVRMPGQSEPAKLLPVDAKFPLADYERLVAAAEGGDMEGERAARRSLESTMRIEARRIAGKYIVPPLTTEFAVLYLPTDGLYAEVARMPGLIDDLGRTLRVLVMGPGLLPGLLRTVHLGYVTLALEHKAEQIGRLLGDTRQEMLRMDGVLERLARSAGSMARTIEDARTRTRVVQRKLRDVSNHEPELKTDREDDEDLAQADQAATR